MTTLITPATEPQYRPPPVIRNAAASTLGASLVALLVTPLDVVKVRMQAHVCPVAGTIPCVDPGHVYGASDAARKIIRAEGVRGLWRGLNVTLALAVPTTGLYFTMYEQLRMRVRTRFPTWEKERVAILAGGSARVVSATLAGPLELARINLQAGVGGPGATVWSVLLGLYRRDGFLALWRGLGPTLVRDAPFSAIYWSAYEFLKGGKSSPLSGVGNDFSRFLLAGTGAGSLAAFVTVPADVIKTRRQANLVQPPGASTSLGAVARDILREEGVGGLYRGVGPRVAKVAPACAIMMGSYEMFRSFFGIDDDPSLPDSD
eukprot:Plantae.Rhodophyta-Hildenbrandia_rubra.ctg12832.p1 GENE.Plantae.Rhodophyta-Hildenbrandia_rubra.ctg12832~~Plantae.Rhodophyta-Hildenbrandia_rubra.ctg12832.p1  ORF type:complete len:333 (+),score=53.10 Plantae.Rhodophyta-Hildenbrandia_rubra.ctg12832:46-999(+)